MSEFATNINRNIMLLRREKGITQRELAEALNVSSQAVSKWESGKCCPDIEMLPVLAHYFEVSMDELFGNGQRLQPSFAR